MELLLSDFHQVLVALVLLVVDVHLESLHLIFELLFHRLHPLLVLMLLMILPPQLMVLDSLRIERSGLGKKAEFVEHIRIWIAILRLVTVW